GPSPPREREDSASPARHACGRPAGSTRAAPVSPRPASWVAAATAAGAAVMKAASAAEAMEAAATAVAAEATKAVMAVEVAVGVAAAAVAAVTDTATKCCGRKGTACFLNSQTL